MSRSVRRTLLLYGLSVVAAVIALHQQASPVLAEDCPAVDQYDQPRDCTFLEEYGQCLFNAADSLDTCLDASTNWFTTGLCWAGWEIDFYACVPEGAVELILP